MRLVTAAILGLLLAGCDSAPSRVSGTLELRPDNVVVNLHLQDLKTRATDPLGQLLQYQQVLEMASKPSAIWSWAPTPTAISVSPEGKRLELALTLSMPRKQFDECAKSRCGGSAIEGCTDFFVKLCDGKYALADPKGLSPIAPTPDSWPDSSTSISFAYRVEEKVVTEGASLLPGKALSDKQSADAASILKLARDYHAAFVAGDVDKCTHLAEAAKKPTAIGAAHLMTEIIRRERQQLLHDYLTGTEEGYGLPQPPPAFQMEWKSPYVALLPKTRLKPEAALRLRVAYDYGAQTFAEDGYAAQLDHDLRLGCQLPKGASAELKKFCALVLVGVGI